MNNEQNIDDILKLLRESVNTSETESAPIKKTKASKETLSAEDLSKTLKEKFSANGVPVDETVDDSYTLDRELLKEFSEEQTVVALAEPEEEIVEEEILEEEILEEEILEEEILEEEIDEEIIDEDLAPWETPENEIQEVEEIAELEDIDEELDETLEQELALEYEEELEEERKEEPEKEIEEEIDVELEEEPTEETEDEVISTKTELDPYGDVPKYKPVSFKTLIMDYGHPDPAPDELKEEIPQKVTDEEEESDTPDLGDIISDFSNDIPTRDDSVSSVVHELMSQLGCEDELDDVSPEAMGEIFAEYEGDYKEYDEQASAERREKRRAEYRKKITLTSIRLSACFIAVVIIFLYDTLPLLGVDFYGIFDYVSYPGAYVIFGAQLLVIAAVCLWKPMIDGFKMLATLRPNAYSMAVVMVICNLLYDTVFLINGEYEPHKIPMFHFVSGTILALLAVTELSMQIRESKSFDLYSSDMAKFTLTHDETKGPISSKMYAGGFSKSKRVYIPTSVSRPKGFTKAITENSSFHNSVYSSMILTSAVVCTVLMMFMLAMERSINSALIASMLMFYVLLPTGGLFAIAIPMSISGAKLRGRGIALTGTKMIRKYSEAKVMVFNDLHLFSKCSPKDVGFVCYENSQMNAIMAALQILYSRIGGPLADVFSNVPDQIRVKRIRVRRITRSGVEALIDRSHILIVGDIEFMKRYGIAFSDEQISKKGRNAILYISYDGKASAKLSASYKVEPLFDMLIERLSAEGGHCVIETYDPMINTEFVARLRKNGRTPISVVHKNAADINRSEKDRPRRVSDNGILAVSSRFKLVEAVVWCSRLCKIEKYSRIVVFTTMGVGAALALIAAIFGFTTYAFQYILAGALLIPIVAIIVITLLCIPRKNYFTVSAIEREDAERMKNVNKVNNDNRKKNK